VGVMGGQRGAGGYHAAPRALLVERTPGWPRNFSRSALSAAKLVREPSMLDLRPISAAPLLCVLACTASYPDDLGEPGELVIADDVDAASISRPLRAPRTDVRATSAGAVPVGDAGLIGHGSSTSPNGGFRGGRGSRVPTVRQARPEVVGALDGELIRRAVGPHVGEVRRCYDTALGRDPNARGRVTIAFEIDGAGKVPAATVQASTMRDPAAGECIAAAMVGWKFPRPRTGTAQVVYAFVLEPG